MLLCDLRGLLELQDASCLVLPVSRGASMVGGCCSPQVGAGEGRLLSSPALRPTRSKEGAQTTGRDARGHLGC